MPDEDGFQVAAAWVSVTPDASDFEQSLDEQLGGLQIAVRVLPDVSDFQGSIDQEDLTADVRLIANAGGFEDQVDQATGDMTATIAVGADVAPARSELHGLLDEIDAARGDLFVSADTGAARKQAEDLANEFSDLSAQFSVGADTGGSQAGVAALTGELGQLGASAASAQSDLGGVSGAVAALESRANEAAGAVGGVIGALAGSAAGVVGAVVVPEVSADFAAKVDEDTAGLTATALILPDVSGLQERLDEQAGALSAAVTLTAEPGQPEAPESMAGGLDDVPAAADRASDAVRVFAATATGELDEVGRAASSAGAALDDYWTQPREMTGISAGSSVDALNGVSQAAAEARASIDDDLDGMAAEAGRLSDALREVDAQFLSMAGAQFGPATDAELADMTARFENLYAEIGDVQGQIAGLRGAVGEAGGDFAGLDAQLGGVSGSLRSFDENLAGTEEALGIVAGDFFEVQEAAGRMGVSVDELGPAMDAAMAGWASRADASKEKLEALNSEAGMMGGAVAEGAGDAEKSVGGLSGVIGTMGERLSYMAVDPFMWMMVGTTAIPELTKAWDALNVAMEATDTQISKQSGASGFNVSGYEEAAKKLQKVADTTQVKGGFLGPLEEWLTGGPVGMQSRTQGAADAAAAMAANLSSKLGTLSGRYNLSSQGAKLLAQAAGVTAKQLGASGAAGDKAMAGIEGFAAANLNAQAPVEELSNDMIVFGSNAFTATNRISAFDDAFGLLAGNFAGVQQAQIGAAEGFLTLKSDADTAGASMTGTNMASRSLQSQFYSQVQSIGTVVDAMEKQKDSTIQVNTYVQDQIDKLSGYAQGSAPALYEVGQLKALEEDAGNATQQTTQAIQNASSELAGQFTESVKNAGGESQTTTGYINGLKTSIEQTGTTSQQTANLRQELIHSLEQAGVKASAATSMVDGFIKKLGQIPSKVNLTLTETAKGTWSESELLATGAANIPGLPGAQKVGTGNNAYVPGLAGGGSVHGGSGQPGADDIRALLSDDEFVVQADAVHHYGVGMMNDINARRFASGGLASSYSGAVSGLGSWAQQDYTSAADSLAGALMSSAASAGRSAQASAGNVAGTVAGALTGASGSVQAMAQKAAAALGWTGAQWAALNAVEEAEAGWRLTATNPTSGAYGIAQFIGGAGEYAQYGGNANTASGQIAAFMNYIEQRYGNPEAAAAHEAQFHWYKNGGRLNPGQAAVVGDGGLPEVVTAGMSGATVTPMGRGGNTVNVNLYGVTQLPSAEWVANIKSEMAFAQIGAP